MSTEKVCPTCGTEYPASERFCPRDGTALRGQDTSGDLVGSIIAERYHVIRKLGEGGMGAVYLAEHVKMGRKSAIKVMNPGMSRDPDAIARFNREAANASRMNHPNICAIYDFGETPEGLIYLAMEYIEGQSLTDLIGERGSMAPARAASILHQAADALQVAHDYGIVHRDLKPDNIMIARGRDDSDLVKVVDFGIAKAHTGDAQKVTKTGLVVGTPEYMSPEQLSGDRLDGRSDIYSLALVGFNMLTGTLPFPAQTAQEMMILRLTDEPKTLVEMRPDVAWPAGLQAVLSKALARDVNARYQKASDFGREFSMAVEAMPRRSITEAGTVVLGAKAAAATAAIPRTRVATDADARAVLAGRARRKPMAWMLGGGGVVVAAIAVALWMSASVDRGSARNGDSPSLGGPTGAIIGETGQTGGDIGVTGATGAGSGGQRGAKQGAPPTQDTANRDVALPLVSATLDRLERATEDTTRAQNERALSELSDALLNRASATERSRIYYLRTVFHYNLNRSGERDPMICQNGRNALRGPGLTQLQIIAINELMSYTANECRSEAATG